MYTVLCEGQTQKFDTLEDAKEFVKYLGVAWVIKDEDDNVVWDYMDRIGP